MATKFDGPGNLASVAGITEGGLSAYLRFTCRLDRVSLDRFAIANLW
jgi:hypothetical protein